MKEIVRILKFILFSLSAGIIQILSFTLLTELTELNYTVRYLTALILSVIWNFTLNRKFTFHSAANVPLAMLKVAFYYVIFTWGTTALGKYLTGELLWNDYLVTIINMALNFITEFLYQRFFVFGKNLDNDKKGQMKIRLAENSDLEEILKVYEAARKYMAENGNASQWGTTHPPKEMLIEDIKKGQLYVGEKYGKVHASFAFISGVDPTYVNIYDGNWINENEYMTIHRIASDGKYRGVFKNCMDFCKEKCNNLRIDTHENNKTMQHVLDKNGFIRCGIIYLENGEPRIAYHFSKK